MKNPKNKKEEKYVSLWDGNIKDSKTPLSLKEKVEKALKNVDIEEPVPELKRLEEAFKPNFDPSNIKIRPTKNASTKSAKV